MRRRSGAPRFREAPAAAYNQESVARRVRQMSRDHIPPVRIGAVNYLNSKPLIEGLQAGLSRLPTPTELRLDYPSRLADDLESGVLDIALIPLVECLRNPDYEVITDACVATHGPVLSVKLYSRVPIPNITSLALDEGSRTSAALARVLLHERFGLQPQLEPLWRVWAGRVHDAAAREAPRSP